MKELETTRTKVMQEEVKGTSVQIDYRIHLESADTAEGATESVVSVFGTISRQGSKLGTVVVPKNQDRIHITFDPFSASTGKEQKAIATTAVANVIELLKS